MIADTTLTRAVFIRTAIWTAIAGGILLFIVWLFNVPTPMTVTLGEMVFFFAGGFLLMLVFTLGILIPTASVNGWNAALTAAAETDDDFATRYAAYQPATEPLADVLDDSASQGAYIVYDEDEEPHDDHDGVSYDREPVDIASLRSALNTA